MIRNATRKRVLVKEHRIYGSVWLKALGLMFRLRHPGYGVLFPFSRPQRVSIHMLFVFFPLDILWLDGRKRVVALRTLRPFTFASPEAMASSVLELPAGTIATSRTRKGDRILF